jgi:squalene-associated FAD-dependent desaturase
VVTRAAVIVVGGGLAGISAALSCADAGADVTLLEGRNRLGGLTYSWRRGELTVDNGQHVFLRCCEAYRALLDRLGVTRLTVLQDRLDIPVTSTSDGRTARLRRVGLPSPLHLGPALLRYRPLRARQRLSAVRAALALSHLDRTDPASDRSTFAEWLRAHGQDGWTVGALWDLVGTATLNARADQASLALAAMVFQVGLLGEPDAADIGWSRVPLQRLHGDAAQDRLLEAGARVRTSARLTRIAPDGPGWLVVAGGEEYSAQRVVLAVPPAAAEALLPADAVAAEPGWSARLGQAPIVNVHLVLGQRVLDEPFLAVVGSPLQWIFDRTEAAGLARGQYLALSISAADGYIEQPVARLRELFLPELARVLPAVDRAELVDFFVTRERAATIRSAPGQAALRAPARTARPGLVLAGAWTDTGWPDTMEGAVRSGQTAARIVLGQAAEQGLPVAHRAGGPGGEVAT